MNRSKPMGRRKNRFADRPPSGTSAAQARPPARPPLVPRPFRPSVPLLALATALLVAWFAVLIVLARLAQ